MFGHRSLPAQHCGCNQGSMHVQVLLPSIRHIRAACIRPHCHERGPYCRELGYSKQGAIRTATLQNLGLSVGAINLTPFATVKACSTEILVGVECLKPGQTACTADANGNIGTGNKGKDNFGSNNVGDHNIGTTNSENYIWANNNTEYGLRRNDATGTRKVLKTCSLKALRKYAFKNYNMPPPSKPMLPSPTVTKSPPPPPPARKSPPPSARKSPPPPPVRHSPPPASPH